MKNTMKKTIFFSLLFVFLVVLSSFTFARPLSINNREIDKPIIELPIEKENVTESTNPKYNIRKNLKEDPDAWKLSITIIWSVNNADDGTFAGAEVSYPVYTGYFYNEKTASEIKQVRPGILYSSGVPVKSSYTTEADSSPLNAVDGDNITMYSLGNPVYGNACFLPKTTIQVFDGANTLNSKFNCSVLVWNPDATNYSDYSTMLPVPQNYSVTATLSSEIIEQIPTIQLASGYSTTVNFSDYNNHSEIIQFPFNISLRLGFTDSLDIYTDELTQQNICTSCLDDIANTTNLEISANHLFEEHNIVFNVSNSTFNRWRKVFFNTNITNIKYSCYSNNSNISVVVFDRDKLNITSTTGWQGLSTVYCNITDGSYIDYFEFDINTTVYDISAYTLVPVLIEDNLLVGQKSYFRFYVYNNGTTIVDDIAWKFDSNATQGWVYSPYNLTIQPKQEQVVYLYTNYTLPGEYYPKVYLDYGNKYLEINEINNNENLSVNITESKVPTVNITSPNQTVYTSSTILINISATDNFGVVETWFNFNNNTNHTYTSPINATLAPGNYTIYAYAKDASNNIGTDNFSFEIDVTTDFRTNLTAYYSFDIDTRDEIGTNNGTNFGATNILQGKLNNAYYFNGTDNYILLPDDLAVFELQQDEYKTVSFWYNANNNGALIGKYEDYSGSSADSKWGISHIYSNKATAVETGYRTGSTDYYETPAETSKNDEWVFVTVVFDLVNYGGATLDGTSYIYINGGFIGSDRIYAAGYYDSRTSTTNNPLIGAFDYYDVGTINNFFNGTIDEIGFWNRKLNETEIKQLYSEGVGFSPLDEPIVKQIIINKPRLDLMRINAK